MLGWLFKKNRIIENPVAGFFDLSGGSQQHLVVEDKEAFGAFFDSVVDSDYAPPKCDVLFLYCTVDPDGKIRRINAELREIIAESGALIVVLASANDMNGYMRAVNRGGRGRANIVLTQNRRAGAFSVFFANLFREMFAGTSMPSAWVKFAPQGPFKHENCPITIFMCEMGQVSFRPRSLQ